MTGAIDVGVMAIGGLVLNMRGRDSDAAGFFFRRLVDLVVGGESGAAGLGENLCDRSCQRRLAMIDVTDGADVAVRFVPFKL